MQRCVNHTRQLSATSSWCRRTPPQQISRHKRACPQHVCRSATGDGSREVYQGMFGPWKIEPADEFEVWSYRVGLTATMAAFVGSAVISGTAGSSVDAAGMAVQALNPLCLLGALGLGVSLVQIHIYVDPLKKALQVLWLLGVLGAVYVASQQPEQPLPLLIAQQPWTIWFVGPAAAAVTGVAIKEGLCYGKPEATMLAVLLPLLCLSHLGGELVAPQVQAALLAGVCAAGAVFAARKYSQPVKDDIGDKSVFEFRKLPEDQQEQLLRELKQQEQQ